MGAKVGKSCSVQATLTVGGNAYAIPGNAGVTAQMWPETESAPLGQQKTITDAGLGCNFSQGIVVVEFSDADMAVATPPKIIVVFTVAVPGQTARSWRVSVDIDGTARSSAVFPDGDSAIRSMRQDRLMLAAANAIGDTSQVSDDYIWEKIQAAESRVKGVLGVPLSVTRFFAQQPSEDQIAALNGMPWEVEPGYDYKGSDWYDDKWGWVQINQKPVTAVWSLKILYPTLQSTVVDVPQEWIRLDGKYGSLQILPTGPNYSMALGVPFMQFIGSGRTLPLTVKVEYDAGITAAQYPELPDIIKKMAVTLILEDSFLPNSGSISADGLSQSMSVDIQKYHEAVDRALTGGDGNGGLRRRIHGVQGLVL